MHLEMAETIKTAVSQQDDALYQQLLEHWPAFYFGQIAPDFSFLAKIKREDTHFYPIPLPPEHDPVGKMLHIYPQLQSANIQSPAHRWFIAGYITHLLYDRFWFLDIISPFFWQNNSLGKSTHRRLVHLLLLCVMDAESLAVLPKHAVDDINKAHPNAWLPFGTDDALVEWQNMVSDQLKPSGQVRTLEIFAPRAELDVVTFSGYFYNKVWMEKNVQSTVSADTRDELKQKTCIASIELLKKYINN